MEPRNRGGDAPQRPARRRTVEDYRVGGFGGAVVPRAVRCARSLPTATVSATPPGVRRDRRTRGPRGGRSTGRVTRCKAPLAVFAVFAANDQLSASPSRRKSWAADGSGLEGISRWRLDATSALAWLAVGIPIAWGVWVTLSKALVLFG